MAAFKPELHKTALNVTGCFEPLYKDSLRFLKPFPRFLPFRRVLPKRDIVIHAQALRQQ